MIVWFAVVSLLMGSLFPLVAGIKASPEDRPEVRQVVRFLDSENVQDILTALDRAQGLPWREIKPYVEPLSRHRNKRVVERVIHLMVTNRDPDASVLVRQKIAHAIQSKERVEAIQLLGQLENPADHGFFVNLLRIENLETRVSVIQWIGRLKIQGALLPLIALLEDSRDTVRAETVRALAQISKTQAMLSIISRLSDSSQVVRQAALDVLTPEDAPMARHALMRLLQTGTRPERMQIFKLLPFTLDLLPHYIELLRPGRPEEIQQSILLFSGEAPLELLREFMVLASQGSFSPQFEEIAPRIRVTDPGQLYLWILSEHSNTNIRDLCARILMNHAFARTHDVLRRAWRLNHFAGSRIAALYRESREPLPVQFLFEIFNEGTLADRAAVVETFIRHKDDRLAPLFLEATRDMPELLQHLLPYAQATSSRLLNRPLIELLKSSHVRIQRSDVLTVLNETAMTGDMMDILKVGPDLGADELVIWSEILWKGFSRSILKGLEKLPVTSLAMEKEQYFLALVAAWKKWPLPSRFMRFRLPDSPALPHVWMHVARHGFSVVPKVPDHLLAAWMDLLPPGKPPAAVARRVSKEPRLVLPLARFAWPVDQLKKWHEKGTVCERINTSHALLMHHPDQTELVLEWLEKETDPLVILNLLLALPPDEEVSGYLSSVCRDQPVACLHHIPLLARGRSKVELSKLAAFPALEKPVDPGSPNGMQRFHFSTLPSTLSCLVAGNAGQGFRALSVLPESDLVVLHLTGNEITLHPQYR